MNIITKLVSDFWTDKYKFILFIFLIFLSIFSIQALAPQIAGDSLLYVTSIKVLETGVQSAGFVPMMILSTFLGLKLIMFFNFFTGSVAVSWLLLDSIFYVLMGMFFYSLVKRITRDHVVAFIATIFLATNYAAVSFGMAYMMDIGGWAFYVASLYFSYRYLEGDTVENKWAYFSGIAIGLGGLYKEYAFVAFIVLFSVIAWKDWKNWKNIFVKVFATGCLAFLPFLVMNVYTFYYFDGYTYLDWFLHNQNAYTYQNRIVEFIKSFGSIYNLLWFFILGGFYILIKNYKNIPRDKNLLFMCFLILPCFSVLLWPVVTRVLFITAPTAILISSLFISKIEKKLYVFLPVLMVYALLSYYMDAYILDFINLPF